MGDVHIKENSMCVYLVHTEKGNLISSVSLPNAITEELKTRIKGRSQGKTEPIVFPTLGLLWKNSFAFGDKTGVQQFRRDGEAVIESGKTIREYL